MRTAKQRSTLDLPDPKHLDRMLSAAPAQLLSRLPVLPPSALEFSEKLYRAALPTWTERVDENLSPYERAIERIQSHFIATQIEAETLLDVYAMTRVVTASMERRYIDWCHKLSELSMSTAIVKSPSNMRMSMVICAPLYMQVHKALHALRNFIGSPIPHRSWTDFDERGNVVDVRRAIYWQLVILLVPMPEHHEKIDILAAILDAYDIAGNFDARRELETECGRGRYDVYDVIRRLLWTHVAVVVIHGWRDIHHGGNALWPILHALREAGIAIVLVATAAIAMCKDDPQFREVFPADPIEFGPYNVDGAANLGRAYATTLDLPEVPPLLVEAVRGVYGFRELMDALARLLARRIHVEGVALEVALQDAVQTVHADYEGVLGPFKHLFSRRKLSADEIARHRDLLPLALVQMGGNP